MIEAWCESCGCLMRLKKGRYGWFYGCTAYPTCRKTMTEGAALAQHGRLNKPKVLKLKPKETP